MLVFPLIGGWAEMDDYGMFGGYVMLEAGRAGFAW